MRSRFFSRPFARFALPLAVALGLGVGARVFWNRRAPAPPLSVSLWYWHRPFRIPPAEAADLRAMGVQVLFVRAATLTRRRAGGALAVSQPQIWKTVSGDAPAVHLVFRVDDSVTRALETLPTNVLADAIAGAVRSQRAEAERAGLRVVGVQLDLDSPTRLLPRYTALLRAVRPALVASQGRPALQLSISALTSWYGSSAMPDLLDAVDFAVPQFYEEQTAPRFSDFAPITGSQKTLTRGLRAAGQSGRPFYAGLAAYGHALVYDKQGTLRGAFHDASAADLLRSPDFRLLRRDASGAGEQILVFAGTHGDAEDFRLVFDLPTPALLQRQIQTVQEDRPAGCRGVILFRYGEPGEGMTLPLPTLGATVRGETPAAPALHLAFRTRRHAPWSPIENDVASADQTEPATDLFVDVKTIGPWGTATAPDAATVTVRFDRPGRVTDLSPGGFDTITAVAGGSRSSLARADSVKMSAGSLSPNQTVTAGPIRFSGSGPVKLRATWRTLAPGGTAAARGEQTIVLQGSEAR